MPFKKTKGGKYRSPSGRIFTKKQVKLYYATGGFKSTKPQQKKPRSKR